MTQPIGVRYVTAITFGLCRPPKEQLLAPAPLPDPTAAGIPAATKL